ncbi:hypothetical protein PILCRDRAFT_825561 [Piloderma croceum F 1598]|uniref:Uncharacterized protein n=1 Tax=Piloderma croceum (strain F 1598) TaxID=765440 RepID=A0A0C3FBW1_PILCF|nr:hypothetical protein PILCRDRAFT_825561 [Piloderma croceum F 1598]
MHNRFAKSIWTRADADLRSCYGHMGPHRSRKHIRAFKDVMLFGLSSINSGTCPAYIPADQQRLTSDIFSGKCKLSTG